MQIDLEPRRPRVISRRQAAWQLTLAIFSAVLFWWLALGNPAWWAPLVAWPPVMVAGALITRLWPLFFLSED